jgi:outer membrane protein assembly factor BamB
VTRVEQASSHPIPWYRSTAAILIAAIVFPPAAITLLWSRREIETGKRVFASICIAGWTAAYLYLIFGSGLFFRPSIDWDAHYAALERQRAEQRETAGPAVLPAAGKSAEQPPPPTSPSTAATSPLVPPDSVSKPGNYWTSFRGRARDGRYDQTPIMTQWPQAGLPLLWKQPIGGGYSSFVVASGIAFTIEQRRDQEVAAAYDLRTGRELWTNGWNAEFKESMGGDGPRATPAWDSGRLYVLGAQGDFRCLDARTGKLIWSKNILKDNGARNLEWGMAASPLIVDDKVIVLPGGRGGNSVVAYNKLNGSAVWKSLDDQAAYSSPMLVTLAGKRQVLIMTGARTVGVDPRDGSLLWSYGWQTYQGISAAQPIVIDDHRVFISAGYGKGSALLEVNDTSAGLAVRAVWENNSMKNKFNSSVLEGGFIYGLDEGILTCIDVASGERRWKGGRYGYGQVMLASGHLIITTEDGDVALVRATPEKHEEIARFHAVEGRTWNCPAISDGLLLVRNQTEMACFDISVR